MVKNLNNPLTELLSSIKMFSLLCFYHSKSNTMLDLGFLLFLDFIPLFQNVYQLHFPIFLPSLNLQKREGYACEWNVHIQHI